MKWEPAAVKAELRLASQKLGQIQARYDSQAAITRTDIATLIQQGNVPLARDKAEKLMQGESFGDLLEELEMQVGLLLEHIRELEHGPLSHIATQAASNIVYAAPYVHSKDLDGIRDYLVSSFGSDFAHSAAENRYHQISSRILRSISAPIPSVFKLDRYLQDIANAFGIDWVPEPQRQEIVNSLSELLNPDAATVVDLPRLQKLCSRGIPDEPSWLRPRIWKLLFGTMPKTKTSWKPEMMKQREAYYDLARQLLGPFALLSLNSALLDDTLRAAYKQLYGLPRDIYTMLEDEPESFSQCPLNEGGRDEAIARLLELRLLALDGQSKYGPGPSPTPEIRLELDPERTSDGPTDTVNAEGLATSTTLIPSRKCMFGYAHPKHCSALLRLLYFHMTINPGNISPHLSSLLVPLYSVLMQEVDPEDLAHVEADTFWLFEAMLAELLGLEDDSGKVWMTKLSERLAWADNDLFVYLHTKGLDPILPYYSYRWLMPMLTHTLPLSSVFLAWDAIFSCPARDRTSNPKLDLFLDVCASMIMRAKPALYRLGGVTQKVPSLWTANAEQLSYSSGLAKQAEDTLFEGVSLLQPFNLSNAGGIERVLQIASDLSQRRSSESITRQANSSLRFRVSMWKEFTSQRFPSNENPVDAGNGTDSKSQDVSTASRNSSLVSQITTTVWKGITNQTAMASTSTPSTPTVPTQFLEPEVEPQTTSNLWSYAEKLKGSDTIAALSKMSSNWRARALLGSSSGGSPPLTSITGNRKNFHDHPTPSSGSKEKQVSPQTSSPFLVLSPDFPLEMALEGSSQQSNRSLIEKTRSLLVSTRSPPPLASKSAPRPLLLTSTLTSSQNGHRNLTTKPDSEDWADVMREKQHHIYRDSLSSTSSLSPSDVYIRTPNSTKSDQESDTCSSRIISLNRRSISPMAPKFRSTHGRLLSRNSSPSSGFPTHSRSPLQDTQTINAHIASESPTILQTYPLASFGLKEFDNAVSEERLSSIVRPTSGPLETEDAESSIKTSRVRSNRYPRPPNLQIHDGQWSHVPVEEKPSNFSQLTVEWQQDEMETASTPRGSRFKSEEHASMPRKLSRSPLRSKQLSTSQSERQRKTSMDTIRDNRQRKVSNGHRPYKISTGEIPKSKRDSSAEDGDDEGYDELLSAYESEDGPKSSLE